MSSDIERAARLYVEAYRTHQRSVKRRSSRAAESERHAARMHRALIEAVESAGRKLAEGGE